MPGIMEPTTPLERELLEELKTLVVWMTDEDTYKKPGDALNAYDSCIARESPSMLLAMSVEDWLEAEDEAQAKRVTADRLFQRVRRDYEGMLSDRRNRVKEAPRNPEACPICLKSLDLQGKVSCERCGRAHCPACAPKSNDGARVCMTRSPAPELAV